MCQKCDVTEFSEYIRSSHGDKKQSLSKQYRKVARFSDLLTTNTFYQEPKMLVGSATRYLAGRSAVQTVYWVASAPKNTAVETTKLVKYGRTLSFVERPERDLNAPGGTSARLSRGLLKSPAQNSDKPFIGELSTPSWNLSPDIRITSPGIQSNMKVMC
uniref:Uncharacterized protein n=1 Tax=Timema poppense TaxID=170557 RepID=A0A7R9CXE2_TIMPO|nr:unnamed protein product [Timema poppensis]